MHDISPGEAELDHVAQCARRILRAVDESAPRDDPHTFDMDLAYEAIGQSCAHDVIAGVMLVRLLACQLYPNKQSFMDDANVLIARIKLADLA